MLKEILYDWGGANKDVFLAVNKLHAPLYDEAMVRISEIADRKTIVYWLLALAFIALFQVSVRAVRHKGGVKQLMTEWVGVFFVLMVGYMAMGLVVHGFKEFFSMPRPYVALGDSMVRVLTPPQPDDAYHSFPSGHVAFTTLIVMSLWPVLSGFWALAGVVWVALVAWSRMACGMHFPADVTGSLLLMLIVVYAVQVVCYTILSKLFRLRL